MPSLLESYSKSEKSPAVDEASSSEERYSSCGVCLKAGGWAGMVSFRPTKLLRRRDALRALFCGSIGGRRLVSADSTSWSSILLKMAEGIQSREGVVYWVWEGGMKCDRPVTALGQCRYMNARPRGCLLWSDPPPLGSTRDKSVERAVKTVCR